MKWLAICGERTSRSQGIVDLYYQCPLAPETSLIEALGEKAFSRNLVAMPKKTDEIARKIVSSWP